MVGSRITFRMRRAAAMNYAWEWTMSEQRSVRVSTGTRQEKLHYHGPNVVETLNVLFPYVL